MGGGGGMGEGGVGWGAATHRRVFRLDLFECLDFFGMFGLFGDFLDFRGMFRLVWECFDFVECYISEC